MGEFDSFADAAFQIKTEGEKITLKFKRGVPNTTQGTIEWNIPVPAQGCDAGTDGAYCGILVVVSNSPVNRQTIPEDGKVYVADPTADSNIHVGDKIGDALVVGAFYEGEKKGRGETLTTSLVISDLKKGQEYYVAAYAVDCTNRYHSDGVRAYSDQYGNADAPNRPATNTVYMGEDGVTETDGTGLDLKVYEFDIEYDPTFPAETGLQIFRISIEGEKSGTYGDLIEQMNKQFSLVQNPTISPIAPNAGVYYWDATNQQLFQFDGTSVGDPLDVLIEPTDPAAVDIGDYWFVPSTNTLQIRTSSPESWSEINFVEHIRDPLNPTCEDYWFSGTQGYSWNGSTWCEEVTYVQLNDPSSAASRPCGSFWYDQTNEQLFEWNEEESRWVERFAILWPTAPNTPSNGDYWFDSTNNLLFIWASGWIAQEVLISTTEPTLLTPGKLWYNPDTEELYEATECSPKWKQLDVIVWPDDPTDTLSCDLWWAENTTFLYAWDSVNSEWDQVVEFIQSPTDPNTNPTITKGELWFNLNDNKLYAWDGVQWVLVDFISWPTDPTLLTDGSVWKNTTNNTWFELVSGAWVSISPVDSETDPTLIPTGTFWFETVTDILYQRNGLIWMPLAYVVQVPWPTEGDHWFDTTNDELKEWQWINRTDANDAILADRTQWTGEWISATPLITSSLDSAGCLVYTSRETGSNVCVRICPPEGAESATRIPAHTHYFGGQFFHGLPLNHPGVIYASNGQQCTSDVALDVFLFDHLKTPEPDFIPQIKPPVYGSDGVVGTTTYDLIDVGDDGTPDERRELMDSIRQQLGYPVVDVELTTYQLDTAVQAALESLRKRASISYKRGFFFLDVYAGRQEYILTDRTKGYHKIVDVTSMHRFTSAFLSSAHGAGVYGQIVLQHLYNMGTYDLTSYFLVSQYVEQLEHLFSSRLVFHWIESERKLWIHQMFNRRERLLMDCAVERTEQELLKDRWCKSWIERYALSEARLMLAEIRGKYGTLPGAGGGVSLNAAELINRVDTDRAELLQQLEDYIADTPEDWGWNTQFTIG